MFDKRTVLAFILIGLILLLTQTKFYQRLIMPERPPLPKEIPAVEDTLRVEEERVVEEVVREEVRAPEIGVKGEEREITIDSDLFRARISSRGGVITSWVLKKYQNFQGVNVELIRNRGVGNLALGFVVGKDTVDLSGAFYQTPADTFYRLDEENPRVQIEFAFSWEGREVKKVFTFYHNRYDFELGLTLRGIGQWVTDRSYQVLWKSSLAPTERDTANDMSFTKIYTLQGKDLREFDVGRADRKEKVYTGVTRWVSLRTKYFVVSVIPLLRDGREVILRGEKEKIGRKRTLKKYAFALEMPLSEEAVHEDRFRIYLGPLEYDTVKDLGVKLEKVIMASGWYERFFRPFSILILRSLRFLHKIIPNYGLVIVIFSILIKIVLYPLTHKSYVSMKKMQMIQPRLAKLREKYKNDPKRLNQEMMRLYKEYGVNPLGGCLPMLLQMPLLIGLFIVFRSTIELRGAKFILWIKDLSQPDTVARLPFSLPLYGQNVNILPLFMGATMFFQQRLTVKDPRQAMMGYLMPIFFTLIFNTFPSGLNLYYSLFNILTIIQQYLIKGGEPAPIVEEEGKKKRRRGKKER